MCYKAQILALPASGREIFAPTAPGFRGCLWGGEGGGPTVKGEKRNKRSKCLPLFDFFLPRNIAKIGNQRAGLPSRPRIQYSNN